MFKVVANSKDNSLYFSLEGIVDKAESKKILNTTIKELEKLTPGFNFIYDTDALLPQTEVVSKTLDNTFKTINEHGIKDKLQITNKLSLPLFNKETDFIQVKNFQESLF